MEERDMSDRYWNPKDYSIENQLSDIMGGKDVVSCDDGVVIKGDDGHVNVFWPSNSEKGHGHAGFEYDDNGKMTGYDIYHS